MATKKRTTAKNVFPKPSKKLLKELFPTLPKSDVKTEEVREYTYGEKVVGVTFNPSNNANITRIKEIAAEMIDITRNHFISNNNPTELNKMLFESAVAEILNAQMNAVKVITFSY